MAPTIRAACSLAFVSISNRPHPKKRRRSPERPFFCRLSPDFLKRSTMRSMNRRTFIGTSIATALAASRPAWAAERHQIDRIGLQLYTVRDLMKNDFDGTIAKVAQLGYKEVEFAGYFGKSPQDVSKILDSNKLTSPSEHVPYETVEKKWPETLEAAHVR